MEVREAGAEDVAALAPALAAAFDDDPVWRWTVPPGARRMDRLQRFFALELAHIALPDGTVWTDERRCGAVMAMPPGKWRMPITQQARHLRGFASVFGTRTPRALGLLTKLESRHLREPHVYLSYIGVAPEAQGQGLGRALTEPALADADARGLPAWLEASSPGSARLYRRLGFADVDEVRFASSPPMLLMRRDPA